MDIDEIPVGNESDYTGVQEGQEEIDNQSQTNNNQTLDADEVITDLLKSKSIADPSKIKFEDDNGEIQEVDWKSLDKQSLLNIINTQEEGREDPELSDDEIKLLNDIRLSNQTPQEYIEGLRVPQESNEDSNYTSDSYSDDELFLYDQQARLKLSPDEAQQALENAKANPDLYEKQIDGIRNDYKALEDQIREQNQQDEENQYQEFTNSIIQNIDNLKSIGTLDIDLTDEDKNNLATFILDKDAQGVNYLSRALNDPQQLTKMAWFALNGDNIFRDLNTYLSEQIKSVSKASYEKGKKEALAQGTHVTVTPPKQNQRKLIRTINDLD